MPTHLVSVAYTLLIPYC